MVGLMQPTAAYAQRNPGVSTVCGEFIVVIPPIVVPIPLIFSMPDEGWAYVNPARKRRQATGIAFEVQTASTDTPGLTRAKACENCAL